MSVFHTKGITFTIGSSSPVTITKLYSTPDMGSDPEQVDATSFDDATTKSYIPGLQDVQKLNFDFWNEKTNFGDAAARVTELSDASRASADALKGITDAADGFGSRMTELKDATGGTADGMSRLQSELTEALSGIRSFSGSMTTAGSDAQDAAKKIKELTDDLDKIKRSSEVGKGSVLSLASGFKMLKGVVATLGIGAFIKDSNDAYNVQMQNELKLTAHMKQRMNATDEQIQSVKDLASAQQKLGIIGDEIQLAGAQQLTTYARQTSTLETLIPAMNNLIAQNAGYEASVGDATSAVDMLGRALNGQYTMLTRQGIKFTEAQVHAAYGDICDLIFKILLHSADCTKQCLLKAQILAIHQSQYFHLMPLHIIESQNADFTVLFSA